MTAYQGGKKRIGKKIHDAMILVEDDLMSGIKLPYFEPFVGMGGVLRHFGKDNDRKLSASDINFDLIMMWNALKKGWKPPLKCSKEKFEKLKYSNTHSAERAFLGVVASFGTNFFHNYRLHLEPKNKSYLQEGYNGLMDIFPDIRKVKFEHGDYDEFELENYLIYCDPPYVNNNLASIHFEKFDHEKFWDVMREWSKNNIVFISESTAPSDFKKIWSTQSYNSNRYKTKRYSDNLYVHKDIYKILSPKIKEEIKNLA
jgi:site-specific DNA-adenine methylase